jgi:acyl-CoA synthetase (AMP-forming)/AMP-acid ligase II
MYLTQPLHRSARQCPDRIAVISDGSVRSFANVYERVSKLGGALKELGLKAGDRVAMLSANSEHFLEYYLAVWWVGGVVNPINVRWSANEIAYSLNDCETTIVIVDETFRGLLEAARKEASSVNHIIYAGKGQAPSCMLSYDDLLYQALPALDVNPGDTDLAAILYTGGTTGFPKGVMLTHANLALPALSLLAANFGFGPVILHATPMFHGATLMFMLAQLMNGGTHVIVPRFSAETVLQNIEKHRVTDLWLVPTMIQMLVDSPDRRRYDLSSVQQIWYGGSTITEAVLERAMRAVPSAKFAQMYGLTEASVSTLLAPTYHTPEGRKLGRLRSAGTATCVTDVKIVDAEGQEVPRGTVGELAIGGRNVMQGYWNKPTETAAALKAGWLHTGDGAFMDAEGLVFIVDRLKDMIVSGGENVYAAEVENAIASHPAVTACAVIGIPDARWGESVHAVIVRTPGSDAFSLSELREFCKLKIAGYKCPRSLEFRDAMPISGAGKVMKTVLRESFLKGRSRKLV